MAVPTLAGILPAPLHDSRLFRIDREWFFDTREGIQYGPYRDEQEARLALAVFITRCLRQLETDEYSENDGIEKDIDDDDIRDMVDELIRFMRLSSRKGPVAASNWAKRRIGDISRKKFRISNFHNRKKILKYALTSE